MRELLAQLLLSAAGQMWKRDPTLGKYTAETTEHELNLASHYAAVYVDRLAGDEVVRPKSWPRLASLITAARSSTRRSSDPQKQNMSEFGKPRTTDLRPWLSGSALRGSSEHSSPH